MNVYEESTVGIVVPAYNEEEHVGEVIETVPAYVDRIYVVEDGSVDGTWSKIQTVADRVNEEFRREDERYPGSFDRRVVAIRHDRNRGVGGAIKTGYLAARRDGLAVTAVMGADGQMPPEYLADIVAPVADGRADYAKGNRLVDPAHHATMPRFRYVGNLALTWLTKVASGYWAIGDPQNGFTAISLTALHAIDVEEMFEYYGYCNDLLVRLNVAGMRVVDVPRPATYADEKSHIDYGEYVPRVSAMLTRTFLWRLRTKYVRDVPHPIAWLYGAGALVAVSSVVATAIGGIDLGITALVAGILLLAGAMTWDRVCGRTLDRRVRPEPDPETSTGRGTDPLPTD